MFISNLWNNSFTGARCTVVCKWFKWLLFSRYVRCKSSKVLFVSWEPKDFYQRIFTINAFYCLFRRAVYNWIQKVSEGRSSSVDKERSSCSVQTATEETVPKVQEITRADRRLTIDSIAIVIVCFQNLAYSILNNHLQYQKVYLRQVPRQLTEKHKNNLMGLLMQHLFRYADEGEDLVNQHINIC